MGVPAPTNGLAVTSMVLGIVSIVFLCLGAFGGIITLPAGIAGIIFGAIGLNQIGKGTFSSASRGMAIAGLITSIIGFAIAVIFIIFVIAVFSTSTPSI